MSAPSKPPRSLVCGCIWKHGIAAGAARRRRSSSAMAPSGSAIWLKPILPRVQIVDLYHARQHLWELPWTLYPNDAAQQKAWMKVHQKRLLDKWKIERLVTALRSLRHATAEVVVKIRTEAEYFEKNAERMRYPNFRRRHLFVGSGVIEAGCKTVIGSRLKKSACSGPSAEPTPFLPSAAATSMVGLRTTGPGAGVTPTSMSRTRGRKQSRGSGSVSANALEAWRTCRAIAPTSRAARSRRGRPNNVLGVQIGIEALLAHPAEGAGVPARSLHAGRNGRHVGLNDHPRSRGMTVNALPNQVVEIGRTMREAWRVPLLPAISVTA